MTETSSWRRIKSLEPTPEGHFEVHYLRQRYRFLFNDGRTVDVEAIRDDSDLREAMLSHFKASKIEGVATLPPTEPPKPAKKTVAAKKAAPRT